MQTTAYVLTRAGAPLERQTLELAEPGPGEAIVEVLACGLCHTDLGFADGSVAPKHPLPLVLGHEIVGRVCARAAASHASARRCPATTSTADSRRT